MSLTKWRIFCITEDEWTEGWMESSSYHPTKCFHNDMHTVNGNSYQELEVRTINEVMIKQEHKDTGGNIAIEGFSMSIPANTIGTMDVSWPFPISTSIVHIQSREVNYGDILNAKIQPHTLVGILTSNQSPGSNIIVVSSTVMENARVGMDIYIGSFYAKRIISMNHADSSITTEYAITESHNIGTYIYLEYVIIRNFSMGIGFGNDLGTNILAGQYLKENTITRVYYTNNSNVTKDFHFTVEYLN